MLKHFWIAAVRNLTRNKLFTAINLIGLSVSIGVFLALTGYVRYQFSYDKFYDQGDRIYRINYYEYANGLPVLETSRTHDRAALLLMEYAPQIEAVARVYNEKAFVYTDKRRIVDQNMLFADSSFFKVFRLKLVSGSADNGLTPPNSVMVSRSQAEAYFGKEDPIGKILYFNENLTFTVTGVFEDIPKNSSIDFDFLLSWSTMAFHGWLTREGDFSHPWTFTFVKLKKHITDIQAVNAALTAMANKHITTLEKRGHTARYELSPYEDLHTSQELSGEVKPGANKSLLYALVALAVFILVAAWINYVNLSLARSLERANEIGVRKVFGAGRLALGGQFMLEAIIVSVATFLTGVGLYWFFTGPAAGIIFAGVTFSPNTPLTWAEYGMGFVVGTVVVAFYPIYFIARFKPALILKNKLGSGKSKAGFLHQGLMIFQMFLAIAIIGITMIAGRQIRFIRDFDSGFNVAHTISLRGPASRNSDPLRYSRFTAFRSEVLQHHAFRSGAASMNIPGQEIRFHDESVHAVGSDNLRKQSFWVMWIDDGYQDTFGMSLVAGRNFNQNEFGNTCLINETAAHALGYKTAVDALNTTLINGDHQSMTIVGIWKDYHHESVHKPVDPIMFFFKHPHEYGYYSFNVQSRQGDYLTVLEKIWNKHYPNDQFTVYFMDEFFKAQYQADEFFGRLLSLFSVLSIVVASLGLFGMASLAIVKRTKEIGVRKALGASVGNILIMLSRSYVKLIAVSCVLAFPMVYYFTAQWLAGFAYRVGIRWWMVVLPGIIVLVATLATIAGQAIRAAIADPIKSLREQ
jgi:putative ABC transport system permease protein